MGVAVPEVVGTETSRLENLKDLFAAAGLEQAQTRTIDVCLAYESFEDFWDAQTPDYAPTTKLIRAMSDGEQKRLKRMLRESLPTAFGERVEFTSRANAVKQRTRPQRPPQAAESST
jgi:hypothetical protein